MGRLFSMELMLTQHKCASTTHFPSSQKSFPLVQYRPDSSVSTPMTQQFTVLSLPFGTALEEAILREKRQLLSFIRKRVRSEEEAADLTQDVLTALVEHFPEITDLSKVTAWLFRTARNKITDLYRKRRTTSFSELESKDEDGGSLDFGQFIADLSQLPDSLNLRQEIWEALTAALEELPANQRDVFLAHELEGQSFEQISAETGVTVNTLLSRKRYAVLHLRSRLEHLYHDLITQA
jgi:RNA polymerase sigma factor (sigma-70 family)